MSYEDPRTQITHELVAGNIYRDSRTGDELMLIYIDRATALLRDRDEHNRLEPRKHFEKRVGSGRYKLAADVEPFGNAGRLKRVESRAKEYDKRGGRKASHYADGLREAVGILTGRTSADDREEVELEDVKGVGEGTADNLRKNGYSTRGDFRNASDEELLSIGGVGETNLGRIRERI